MGFLSLLLLNHEYMCNICNISACCEETPLESMVWLDELGFKLQQGEFIGRCSPRNY